MIIATIAAITILLSGGAGMFSFDIFKSGAENYVNDPARLKQIEMVIENADDEVKTFNIVLTIKLNSFNNYWFLSKFFHIYLSF